MTAELITEDIWKQLTKAAKSNRQKSYVAVAYFGKGGAKMLPLAKGSVLLVDASEGAVRSGLTNPTELLLLYRRGIDIYSLQDLHAKLYVFGSTLFIGSANVSGRSSDVLTEAVFKTNRKKAVADARAFILSLCDVPLGPDGLKKLEKIYRPPRIPGGKATSGRGNGRPGLRRKFFTCQLETVRYEEDEAAQSAIGQREAAGMRIHSQRHVVEEFLWNRPVAARRNDVIMQVVDEGGAQYVSPPGILIHKREWRSNGKTKTLCFVEVPVKRRKNLRAVLDKLGKADRKSINRNGARSRAFAEAMYGIWNIEQ